MSDDPVLVELDQEIRRLEQELAKVREFRSWWGGRHSVGSVASPRTSVGTPSSRSPRTLREWLLLALSNGARMAPPEMVRTLLELGWQTKSKSPSVVVRNTLVEMVAKGEVNKGEDGKYMLPRQAAPEQQRELGLSVLNGAEHSHAEGGAS